MAAPYLSPLKTSMMVNVFVRWDIFRPLKSNSLCFHLISVLDGETIGSTMKTAAQQFISAKMKRPLVHQLVIHLFANVLVGIAYILGEESPDDSMIRAYDFMPQDMLTRVWNAEPSSNQSRHPGCQQLIREFIGFNAQTSQFRGRSHITRVPVIIVKVAPHWVKICLFCPLIMLGCIGAGLGIMRVNYIFVLPAAFLMGCSCLVCYAHSWLKVNHRTEQDEKNSFGDMVQQHESIFLSESTHNLDVVQRYNQSRDNWNHSATFRDESVPSLSRVHTDESYDRKSENMRPKLRHRGSNPPFANKDYTVGWICALPIEMASAKAMLDEVHADLPALPYDDNTYILGRIGTHNIAITCLPTGIIGAVSAATVAARMRSTFQSIRFGLIVGIGGGVPSRADIRLGDVVVGKPTNFCGGVLQFDTNFEQPRILNRPPDVLLNALSKLQANHFAEGNHISSLLSGMLGKHPQMRDKIMQREEDRLFSPEYHHSGLAGTCHRCDRRKIVTRSPRTPSGPCIYYGRIASSPHVLRDSTTRDRLSQKYDILCFEMEAAGIMDNFPYLVIRGISDYADSHKNDNWQGYAAAVAAAYTKELLLVTPSQDVDSEGRVLF